MCPRSDSGSGPVNYAQVDSGTAELLRDADRASGWILLVDGTPQSYVDLDDPQYLDFEYVRRLGHLIDLAAEPGEPLRVLHLGGGGLTLARYVAATRPGSSQLAVDADAALVEFVRERLPLDQPPRRSVNRRPGRLPAGVGRPGQSGQPGRIRIRIGDAREVLGQLPAESFDLVLADLFCGGRTAAHLTSAEFTEAAARVLTADGVFAVNVGDGRPLAHARARVATLQQVFGCTCVIADAAVLKGRRFGNLVLAASQRGLPVDRLERRGAGDPFPGRLVYGDDLDKFVAGAKPITDADAEPSPAPPSEVINLRPQG
ncbi:MAG TPA: fused MFS/spermidine synthase [Streptosporangiaceae bacterium]